MTVSQKKEYFKTLEVEKPEEPKPGKSPKTNRRFQDRKKQRERNKTQPVTEEELHHASDIAKNGAKNEENANTQTVQDNSYCPAEERLRGTTSVLIEEETKCEDELSKLSLSDKMKLFSEKKEEVAPPPKIAPPLSRRKHRKGQSRFKTQHAYDGPITEEEVHKAANYISPLAMSMVKPPDPEILQGMSLKDQRNLMVQWAENTLKAAAETQKALAAKSKENPDMTSSSVGQSLFKKQQIEDSVSCAKEIISANNDVLDGACMSRKEPPAKLPQLTKQQHQQPQDIIIMQNQKDPITRSNHDRTSLNNYKNTAENSSPKIMSAVPPQSSLHISDVKSSRDSTTDIKDVCKVKLLNEPGQSSGQSPQIDATLHKENNSVQLKETPVRINVSRCESPPSTPKTPQTPPTPKTPDLCSWDDELVERVSSVKKRGLDIKESSSMEDDSDRSDRSDKANKSKNEAVERRRRRTEERKAKERYNTQPIEGSPPHPQKYGTRGRSTTNPITDAEHEQEGVKVDEPVLTPKSSIQERLNKLQQSGEDDWKKRVAKADKARPYSADVAKLREKNGAVSAARPTSIQDRMSLLNTSHDDWRSRVEDKDVTQFTHEGKLKLTGKKSIETETPSPLMARRRKMRAPLTRAKSAPVPLIGSDSDSEDDEKSSIVIVPQVADEDFQTFFNTKTVTEINTEKVNVTLDDFNYIITKSNDILPSVRKTRPRIQRVQRPGRPTSKNPMRSLQARTDLQAEYTEVQSGVADLEMKRIKTEQIAGKSTFALDALAGLAAKADFSKVSLRKTESFGGSTPGTGFEPFQAVMLLQVKGRRHCQTRLVEPCANSINSGDCFILVTMEKVFLWVGEFCNVIEKAKAQDVVTKIHQKRDLGCKGVQQPYQVDEQKQAYGAGKTFWNILGGMDTYQDCGPQEEDELFEMYTTETNRVYRLDTSCEKLSELQDYSGNLLSHKMLNTKMTYVFDFGSEMYVWTGKNVPFSHRKMALRLAKELWDIGYDYSGCDINPLCPLLTQDNGGLPMTGQRPDWALFAKINENMETILFKEKFCDWPDQSTVIKVKDVEKEAEVAPELVIADVTEMLPVDDSPISMVLDGQQIGRGVKWVEMKDGRQREFDVQTMGVAVWHIMENDRQEMPELCYGQFHDGDTYVVRWNYMVTQKGLRNLKGEETRHSGTGRDRCAYFFWQGRHTSVTEKCASALMTVELDEEHGPHVRVEQGKELPSFVRLFDGKMIIHRGHREVEDNTAGDWRLYILRHELSKECYLLEVVVSTCSLRSRGSLILINVTTGELLLWHGSKVAEHTKQQCTSTALSFKKNLPLELDVAEGANICVTAIEEGRETDQFYAALGSGGRADYHCMLSDTSPKSKHQFTPRLFHMCSVSGVFKASEVMNPMRNPNQYQPFPFVQSDLYKASQPGLFMVDNDRIVYLWQGWWPEGTEETDNVTTGSSHARFNVNRKLALETTLNYCKAKNPSCPPPSYLIYAGCEPVEFSNIFPYWEVDPDVLAQAEGEGRTQGHTVLCSDLLDKLSRTRYSMAELKDRPLPDGVDPLLLETYLEDDEFMEVTGMSREDWAVLPHWKQGKVKQSVGLF